MFKKKCYFSALESQSRTKNPLASFKENHEPNAKAFYFSDAGNTRQPQLFIRHNEGMEFSVPIIGPLTGVFPLPDGLLVELPYYEDVSDSWLSQTVKGVSSSKYKIPHYSYFSLLTHPLNDFRLEKLVFSSQDLPLVITYNFETKCHIFYALEIDTQSITETNEKLNFQELNQTLDPRESNFTEKALKGFSDVSLREIFRDSNIDCPASKIKITTSVYNPPNGGHKQQAFVYMLTEKGTEKSLRVFSITYSLHEKGNKLFFTESVKRLRVFEGVSTFTRLAFLIHANEFSFFKSKNYLLTSKKSKQGKIENDRNKSILDPSKFEKRFLAYLGQKMTTHLFKSNLDKDAIVIFRPAFGLSLVIEDFIIMDIPLSDIHPSLIKCPFSVTKMKALDNSTMLINCRLPIFRDEFTLSVISILKEVFDRHLFWGLLIDLVTCCNNESSVKSSEFDLVVAYFACLLCQDNLKKSTETFEELLMEHSEHQSKQIHVSYSGCNSSKQSLDALMNEFNANKSLRFIREKTLSIRSHLGLDKNLPPNIDSKTLKIRENTYQSVSGADFGKSFSQEMTSKDARAIFKQILPKVSISIQDFALNKVKLLKCLHLLNEDLRICKTRKVLSTKITYLLYVYSYFLGVNHAKLYSQYYMRMCPEILIMLKSNEFISRLIRLSMPDKQESSNELSMADPDLQVYFNEHLSREIFDILDLLNEVFTSKNPFSFFETRISRLPIIFENTYNIMKVIALITSASFKGKKYRRVQNLDEPKTSLMSTSAYLLPFVSTFFKKCDKDRFKQKMISQISNFDRTDGPNSHKFYNRLFFLLIKNNISLSYIESLIDSCEYFYKSVLSILRKEISSFLTNVYLPRSAYQLLQREDLHANQLMSPFIRASVHPTSHHSAAQSQAINLPPSAISSSHPVIYTPNATYLPSSLFIHGNDEARQRNETSLLYTPLQKMPSLINPPFKTAQNLAISQTFHKSENHPIDQIIQLEQQLTSHSHTSFSRNLHYSKNDALFSELYRLYACSDIIFINSKALENLLNIERMEEERANVELQFALYGPLCERLSSFIGRGALDLNTEQIGLTDVIKIPSINISGKLKGNDLKYTYIFNPEQKEDKTPMNWCDFHNGVAASLSISKRQLASLDKESMRTWIEYQKTENHRYDHAGLLFGLGLQGFFNCFNVADIYFNLKAGNDARIIGTILGLATSKLPNQRANMEETILKAFNLHLEFNYMAHSEIQINRTVQAASMIGIGLYHKGLCKKSISETMLTQIEAKPFNENNNDRECHSLAAGFALGLINLGKGSNVPSIKELKLDEKLFSLIKDGSKGSKFSSYDSMNTATNSSSNDFGKRKTGYKASNVRETAEGNLIMTSPSALMALTLIHMKTNNINVANRIEIPKTIYEIIHGNPLTVFLKIVAKHLILWDSINISPDFVTESIPELIKFLNDSPISEIAEQYLLNSNFEDIDFHNLSLIYYNIISGTLLAMALKFAGTGDETLKSIIISYIRQVESLKIIENEFCLSQENKNRVDIHSYHSLLCSMSLSLSILMAGKCDVDALKVIRGIIRKLRRHHKLPDSELNESIYGFHMALQMATGFLFLGNGALTFGNGDFQIACILISIYPVFPSSFSDNRHHLQALRHFYVLASEEKLTN